jgi:uncharacterized protein (DUF2062 family)
MQRMPVGNNKKKRLNIAQLKRWSKYKYIQLLRAKGGPSMVAMGFSIGIMIEMFTLPTGGLAFFLIFPLVYLLRASLAGALLGFLFGKIIYIPFAFLNKKIGHLVIPEHFRDDLYNQLPIWLSKAIGVNLDLIVGGIIDGAILAIIVYFPIIYVLKLSSSRRKEKRKGRQAQLLIGDSS